MVDSSSRSPSLAFGVAAGIAAAAGFSLKAVLAKLVYRHHVDPTTLLALRMALAAPFYVALAIHTSRGAPPLGRGLVLRTVGVGILGYFAASYFDFHGLDHISAGLERLVLYLYPTIVLAIGAFAFGKEVTRHELAGLFVAYAGLALALSHDVSLGRDTGELAIGTAYVFLSALTYAGYVVGSGEIAPRVGSARFTAIAMLGATVPMLVTFAVVGEPTKLHEIPPVVFGLAALMAVFATVVPSVLMTESIRRLGSGRAAIVGSVGPVLTIGLESALLGEPISTRSIVGTVLVVGGVLGASLVPAREPVVRGAAS